MSTKYKICEYYSCNNQFKARLSGPNRPKKFCSMDCYNLSRSVLLVCLNTECGVEFHAARHENRKYCSLSCSAIVNNNSRGYWATRPSNPKSYECNSCGSQLDTKRRFCAECTESAKASALQEKIDTWIEGDGNVASYTSGELAKWARNHLYNLADHKCTVCGWGEVNVYVGRVVLTIDHVDGDWTNNSFTNLKVLCWNCHSLTPTFGALNIGNSPRIRPSLHQVPKPDKILVTTEKKTAPAKKTKIDWPDIDELILMISSSNYSALSRKLGVSDNAIRKRVKSAGYDTKTLTKIDDDTDGVV